MSSRPAFWCAVATSALIIAIAVRMNTFTPWGTDAAAYIEEAHRWANGDLFAPLPLQLWANWPLSDWTVAPHGFRPGVERGTEVGQYPLGLPVLMAAAIRVGGPLAAYLVVPAAAGLLVWCSYILASQLAGNWAGVLAALIMAASPITLICAVQPMSDVPAAAFWALAWLMTLRPGVGAAAAAGAATAMAIMIRPNLAPLALILTALVLVRDSAISSLNRSSAKRLAAFLGLASVGPLIVGWSHLVLYGGFLRSGYLAQDYLFSLEHVPASLVLYPTLLITAHTPVILAGLVAALVSWWPPLHARLERPARIVVWSAVGLVTINYLLYLPYVPLPDPGVLRFMQVAITALVILLAGLLVRASRAFTWRGARIACCVVPAAVVMAYPIEYIPYAMRLRHDQEHARLAGYYLREALPSNAAIIASTQGTGLSHFTKRMVVRFDGLQPSALDHVVAELQIRGYRPVLILDGDSEVKWFQAHFAPSPLRQLDWPPRAIVLDTVKYWDFMDREAFARGERWSTDVIRFPE